MHYAERLGSVQAATINAITAYRDYIADLFAAHEDSVDLVDTTLKQLFSYMSERSQSITLLVSWDKTWDAEILLRSFYEANAKIWLICLAPDEDERSRLAEDLWGEFAAVHNRKRANRADAAAKAAKEADKQIFNALMDSKLFPFSTKNQSARRNSEHVWSFSGIIKTLAESDHAEFNLDGVAGFLHMYGIASHLIHADNTALDLMADRAAREPGELAALSATQTCRIHIDLAAFWLLSLLALAHRYGLRKLVDENVFQKYDRIGELAAPIYDDFHTSQEDLYNLYDTGGTRK